VLSVLLFLVKLNGRRLVTGVLRGFDQFMNLVVEDCVELVNDKEKVNMGSVVIRGNSILLIESLEKI